MTSHRTKLCPFLKSSRLLRSVSLVVFVLVVIWQVETTTTHGCIMPLFCLPHGPSAEDATVSEAMGMNIFFFLEKEDGTKELCTPPLDGTILPGINRATVIELCNRYDTINSIGYQSFFVNQALKLCKHRQGPSGRLRKGLAWGCVYSEPLFWFSVCPYSGKGIPKERRGASEPSIFHKFALHFSIAKEARVVHSLVV